MYICNIIELDNAAMKNIRLFNAQGIDYLLFKKKKI